MKGGLCFIVILLCDTVVAFRLLNSFNSPKRSNHDMRIELSDNISPDNDCPPSRSFVNLPGPVIEQVQGSKTVRVLQFNVLADGLCAKRESLGYFSRIDKKYLDWEYRKTRILNEIIQYDPDVITLQEVDHYYDYFLVELFKRGYVGHFAPKPTSACLDVSPNGDGLAFFVKKSKLNVISCETKTLALSIAGVTESGELIEDDKSIMAQNQVILIAICELVDTEKSQDQEDTKEGGGKQTKRKAPPIIISTTHLKSSKTATGERYRLMGVGQILNGISRIYSSYTEEGRRPVVILSGDFNSCSVNNGYEPLTYRAVKQHALGLRSVYNEDVPNSLDSPTSQNIYTNWKWRYRPKAKIDEDGPKEEYEVRSTIDYIFYSPFKRRTVSPKSSNTEPLVAVSGSQIGIAVLLRFTVYFFGALFPFSSLLSTELLPQERQLVLIFSIVGLILFEINSSGSVFRPAVSAAVDVMAEPVPGNKRKFLTNVATISQSIQPLPQYGRPGFQATAALDVYSDAELGTNRLPSREYPSDHLSIVADLMLLWEE